VNTRRLTAFGLCVVCLACTQAPAPESNACPPGTRSRRTRLERWCETPTGLKDGPGETFYETGEKRTAGNWKDNKRIGTWHYWRTSGQVLQEVIWRAGTLQDVHPQLPMCPVGTERRGSPPPHGQAQWCQKRRHRGTDWVNHGPFLSWHDDGEPQAEGSYLDGEPDGEFTMWYPDGSLKVRGRYDRGKEDGLFLSWHDNGRLFIRAIFAHGKEEGPLTSWWVEGTISAEGTFRVGLEQGSWTFWHPNGKRSAEGSYEAGKKTGWWHTWTADGNAEPMELYENGVHVGNGIEAPPTHSGD